MRIDLSFFAVILLSGALQGCDFLSAPDQRSNAQTAASAATAAVQSSPSPTPVALAPEVEPASGQPIQVASPVGSPVAAASAPTVSVRQPASDPWQQFREDCASKGGTYFPPSAQFGQPRNGCTIKRTAAARSFWSKAALNSCAMS